MIVQTQDAQADGKPQMTEEQVDAANEAEFKKWEGDFDPETLKVPYSRDEKKKEDDKPDEEEDISDKDKKAAEDEQEQVETYTDPAPVVTVADPGEYKPADYSFEVTLKDGKTHKVATPEEADKLAEDPENFETPKQLLDFMRRSQKMENQLEKDKEKWEMQKKTFDDQTAEEKARQEQADGFTKEMLYLMDKGLLPEITDPQAKQRWLETDGEASKDKEFVKTPGVKEQVELLNYFVKENERRMKAGVRVLTSMIDTYNAWQQDPERKKADEARHKEEDDKRAAGEARRAAGARIAGVSASNQAPYVPKGVAVGRVINFHRDASVWQD